MTGKYILVLKIALCCTGALFPVFFCHCSRQSEGTQNRLIVYVSIPPQKYFVEKIGGDICSVRTLIPLGASPHTFEPKPSQMAALGKASCYFAIGVEMEEVWLPKIRRLCPELKIVPTDSGIIKRPMERAIDPGDRDEDIHHENHRHHGDDPHIWLSPDLVKLQAKTIAGALAEIDTAHATLYYERSKAFETQVDSVRLHIAGMLEECHAPGSFMAFHPSWGYFADAFSLRQVAVEMEGKEPGIRQLGRIVALAKQEGIRTVLVQPQFSTRTAQTIAEELGGTTVVADPLAEDWARNLERVAGVLCGR